jgi:uncharacterized protein
MRFMLRFAFALLAALALAAFTPQQGARDHPPATEPNGAVSWAALASLETSFRTIAPLQTEMTVDVAPQIRALDGQEVKIAGFIYPLEGGETHRRFLLSAYPPSCPFCLPGGPAELVEVECADPVRFSYDPVTLAGRFSVLKDDPGGLLYRLSEARAVAP